MQDNYQKIYKNMETNSIGSEKRCNKKIIKKNVKLNITLAKQAPHFTIIISFYHIINLFANIKL